MSETAISPESMTMRFHPMADLFPLLAGEEFAALVDDVRRNGVREPIWLLDGAILDGRNRFRAAQATGRECPFREYRGDDPAGFVVSLNLRRRHLNESQRAMVAAKLANLEVGSNQHAAASASLQTHPVSQSRAADLLNVSTRTVAAAAKVRDEAAPELAAAVESGRVSVSAAADVATLPRAQQTEIVARGEREILEAAKQIRTQRAEVRRAENEQVRTEAMAMALPAGKYRCIVIDPPWPTQKYERDVRPNQSADLDYPTMTHDEIAALDVIGMASDDGCHLFCWTTQKHLPETLNIIDGWGFAYCLVMVWHKPGGPQPFGLPQYNCEFVVYARRNAPLFVDTKQFFACFEAPRREHSRKPDEFYDVIRRVTSGPRIDVFSREKREGFEQFGAETGKFAA